MHYYLLSRKDRGARACSPFQCATSVGQFLCEVAEGVPGVSVELSVARPLFFFVCGACGQFYLLMCVVDPARLAATMFPQGAVQHYRLTYCFSTIRLVPLLRTMFQLQVQVCFESDAFCSARLFACCWFRSSMQSIHTINQRVFFWQLLFWGV